MGLRGPLPKANSLRVLEGQPRRDRMRKEVKPTPGDPPCPQWLEPGAQEIWWSLVPELRKMALLATIDLGVLASYATALDQYREALEKKPDVTNRSSMLGLASIEGRMLAAARELGLTPASRARMGTKGEGSKQERDDLDEMMVQSARKR